MNNISREKLAWPNYIIIVTLFLAACLSAVASAQNVPLALNLPTPLSVAVMPGQTSAEITLSVSSVDNMRLQVIAPVNGAKFVLLDQDGIEALTSADPNVAFLDGTLLSPPLPGGVFLTPTIENPGNGDWKLQFQFPPATDKTVIVATLFTSTPYKVGIVLDRSEYRVGQTISIGMIALQSGQPITGLSPVLTITPPAGMSSSFTGMDDGDINHFDGLADDGIYSGGYTFTSVGTYTVEGSVTIPTDSSPVQRTASAIVTVTEPLITLDTVEGSVVTGTGGCVAGLNVRVLTDVLQASDYVVSALLNGSNGNVIEKSLHQEITSSGEMSFDLFFSADDIRNDIGVDGPYTVNPVDILSFGASKGISLEVRKPDAYIFPPLTLNELCMPDIAIVQDLTVTQTLRDGFIDSLLFSFPVNVNKGGSYQISFKVLGQGGQDIELFGFNQTFAAGSNTVEVKVPYDKFQAVDGPYSVESVLIIGQGASAQASLVGSSSAISRWQFFPRIYGDLDADGDVDVADRTILLGFKGNPVLNPGDRRDLNNDGRIDIRDARYIRTLACTSGSCIVN